MKYLNISVLLISLVVFAPLSTAEDIATRSPGDMSVEERVEMMTAANQYNACVYKHAMEMVGSEPDIRRVADMAMGACEPGLNDLHGTITTWGFEDGFADSFTQNVRNRAARKILPELAVRASR